MISSVAPSEFRLDKGRLSTDSSPISFWQYMDTRIIDINTGEVTDAFTYELAIPLERRRRHRALCACRGEKWADALPQPDGRFTTIRVKHGDQLTVAVSPT